MEEILEKKFGAWLAGERGMFWESVLGRDDAGEKLLTRSVSTIGWSTSSTKRGDDGRARRHHQGALLADDGS